MDNSPQKENLHRSTSICLQAGLVLHSLVVTLTYCSNAVSMDILGLGCIPCGVYILLFRRNCMAQYAM